MAALFKVARHDKPTERKAIKASSIDGLILAAKNKLKLADDNYKLYTDDFTEIDEDEILMDMAKGKGSDQLILTIVPEEITWNGNVSPQSISVPSTESSNVPVQKTSFSHQLTQDLPSTSLLLSHQADHLSNIFPKLSTNVQTTLSKGLKLSPPSRRRMIHTVRDYLLNDIKNTTRGMAHAISEQIVSTYKKTFTTKISNESIDGEIQSLRQAIYYATHYMKNPCGNARKPIDSSDDDDVIVTKPKVQDEYGCVAYMPVQPPSDILASLEEKRMKLIDIFNYPEGDINDEIIGMMDASYFLQRKEINKEKDLLKIFEHWPYFHHHKIIVKHANQLLGKDTNSLWKSSLKKLSKPINRWSKHDEIAREVNNNKKKNNQPDERKNFVRDTLKNAKQHSESVRNDEPYHAVTFGLMAKFMQENSNFLYVLTNEELTDDELLEKVPVSNPVLMIRGKDLHDSGNVYDVVIDKGIKIHAPSFLDGILATFLCYYVFGLAYPPEIEGTLEAIQRLFLEICPPKGTKRGGKRKATNIHPKVSKLMKAIDPYIADESL